VHCRCAEGSEVGKYSVTAPTPVRHHVANDNHGRAEKAQWMEGDRTNWKARFLDEKYPVGQDITEHFLLPTPEFGVRIS